jgi:hypothetical protein
MNGFAVESIQIAAPADEVFAFVADRETLPQWTVAFRDVRNDRAIMRTPRGEVEVSLGVTASRTTGIIDWTMTFPDGTTARAFSRVVALDDHRSAYAFILPAPVTSLEQLEGDLDEQREALRKELANLRDLLERRR